MVAVVVDGVVLVNTEVLGGLNRVDVGAEEEELPAVLRLFVLNHRLNFGGIVATARVLHAVSGDDEESVLGDVLLAGILVDVPDVVDSVADGVEKSGAAPHIVVLACHWPDVVKIDPVVDDLAFVVEQDCRDERLAILFLLLLDHRVETADGVLLEALHRATSVEYEDEFR